MTKKQAIYIFRNTKFLAKSLGLTVDAIYKWPEVLTDKQEKRVLGAAAMLKIDTHIPEGVE